jgi:hypothetical protein
MGGMQRVSCGGHAERGAHDWTRIPAPSLTLHCSAAPQVTAALRAAARRHQGVASEPLQHAHADHTGFLSGARA